MGMYTLLVTDVWLKPDTPPDVLTILSFMVNAAEHWDAQQLHILPGPPGLVLPDAPLFATGRWQSILTMCGSFLEDTESALAGLHLRTQSNFKNYNGELRKFLWWLGPYIDGTRLPRYQGVPFVGRQRYEEDDGSTGLWLVDGEVKQGPPWPGYEDCTSMDGRWPQHDEP